MRCGGGVRSEADPNGAVQEINHADFARPACCATAQVCAEFIRARCDEHRAVLRAHDTRAAVMRLQVCASFFRPAVMQSPVGPCSGHAVSGRHSPHQGSSSSAPDAGVVGCGRRSSQQPPVWHVLGSQSAAGAHTAIQCSNDSLHQLVLLRAVRCSPQRAIEGGQYLLQRGRGSARFTGSQQVPTEQLTHPYRSRSPAPSSASHPGHPRPDTGQ